MYLSKVKIKGVGMTFKVYTRATHFQMDGRLKRHNDKTQQRRAFEYCEYLNKGIVVQPPIGT